MPRGGGKKTAQERMRGSREREREEMSRERVPCKCMRERCIEIERERERGEEEVKSGGECAKEEREETQQCHRCATRGARCCVRAKRARALERRCGERERAPALSQRTSEMRRHEERERERAA